MQLKVVMRGLDPRIHVIAGTASARRKDDCRSGEGFNDRRSYLCRAGRGPREQLDRIAPSGNSG